MKKMLLYTVLLLFLFTITGCKSQYLEYYGDENNYITATGCVTFTNYSDDDFHMLVIACTDLKPTFDDNCFKITGKNYDIILKNGIKDILRFGDEVTFMVAPKYFGDGYIYPVVALWINNECLLPYEEGYQNLLEWIRNK